MKWQSAEDYGKMSQLGAEIIYSAVVKGLEGGRHFNLGLATGNTMIELYKLLAGKLNAAKVSLKNLRTYNLDEYVGDDMKAVPETHKLSYRKYMRENLFSRFDKSLGFDEKTQAFFPDPVHPDAFDKGLADAGGLDFQLLGIGFNGHIAFNEPMPEKEIGVDAFGALPSHVVKLKELTLQTNSKLTAGDDFSLVPRHAVTMGMKQILAAREILLLACFAEQQEPLSKMKTGKVTPELPASYILRHANSSVIYTSDKIKL